MPAFTTVLGLAAVAGSLVGAAPVERAQPSTYYTPYLEEYDAYHLRYLALDCQDQHDTAFFESCCHPLVVAEGQTLADRPSYCTPNATEIASASSYIASTSASGAPTSTEAANGSPAATTSSSDDGGASEYSAQAASSTLTTQAALAPTTTSSSQAQQTTSQSSGGSGGAPSGANTGGYATFFYQNGNPGACGNYNPDSKPLVAIDKAWWPNFGQTSQYCGRYVTIQNNNNGKTVVAEVQDVCPTCANGNSLDLSTGAFDQIADQWEGQVPITWWFN